MIAISEIAGNQNVDLIHCQSTLNRSIIISEICYMNEKSFKAVDVNHFKGSLHPSQTSPFLQQM